MEISTAAGQAIPASESPSPPVAAAEAPERSFAAVLAEGPTLELPPRAGKAGCPISTPILDLEQPLAPERIAAPPDRTPRIPPAGATLEVVGERAGRPPSPEKVDPARGAGSWQRLADDALAAEGRIDRMIEAARQGRSFTASELIGLQMEVFRYSQTVEVISRTTDKIVSALKQVLGTQV